MCWIGFLGDSGGVLRKADRGHKRVLKEFKGISRFQGFKAYLCISEGASPTGLMGICPTQHSITFQRPTWLRVLSLTLEHSHLQPRSAPPLSRCVSQAGIFHGAWLWKSISRFSANPAQITDPNWIEILSQWNQEHPTTFWAHPPIIFELVVLLILSWFCWILSKFCLGFFFSRF